MATELAWSRLSDKWKNCDEFKQHFWSQKYGEMTREERENAMKQISKPCPDPNAYQKSRSFKFTQPLSSSSTHTPSTVVPVSSSSSIGDLAQLVGQFSREEISSFSEKANPYPQRGLARRLSNWLIFSWQWYLTSLKSTAFEEKLVFLLLQFFQLQQYQWLLCRSSHPNRKGKADSCKFPGKEFNLGQHICTQISCSQSATSQAFTRRGNSINPDCFGRPPLYIWNNWWHNCGQKEVCQTQWPSTECTPCPKTFLAGVLENVLDARNHCPQLLRATMRRMTRSIALAILKRTTSGTSPPKGTRQQLRPSIIT